MIFSIAAGVTDVHVVRGSPGLRWCALAADATVGEIRCFVRPDRRCFVFFDSCSAEAFAPLVSAAAAEMRQDLYAEVDEADTEVLLRHEKLGFSFNRLDNLFVIPTDPNLTGLVSLAVASDFTLVQADRVEETRLRSLDDALRQDVPGTDGWKWDEAGFREEMSRAVFDPATYLVAVEGASGQCAGLARIWNDPARPRLGLIAVLPQFRRRGLARALLAEAFAVLADRGKTEVSAEVDETNIASLSLIESLGARRIGGTIELIRHKPEPEQTTRSL
jgi:ribosomal protein S18 acetylase RimI-like enzyme